MDLNSIPQFKDDVDAALRFYFDWGFHIERDVFSEEDCERIVQEAARLSNAQNGSFAPEMMPHRSSPIFLEAMKNATLVEIMKHLVGGKVSGLQSEFFYCKPGTRGFAKHQDNFYVEADPQTFASAWAALTDITPEKGALRLYPKTHMLGRLPVQALQVGHDPGQDKNANNEETVVPKELDLSIPASMRKGSVCFIHANVVHSSGKNETNEYRYALLNTYIRAGSKFRAGNTARREEVPLI